ncbi:MAG: PQQ-binding-like beta-propeller repeat protein [Verrucomicrobiae bacterium]|nr:PQQ-binding-like beta-propeller repeat protein [Verrucomicrobiae bacterium]
MGNHSTTDLPPPAKTSSDPKSFFGATQGRADVIAEFGNYELLEEVGRGGVGVVFKARQKGLDRIVALKLLLSGPTASQDQLQRFLTEARAAARLQHPNIVPIHDFGVHDGQHYFTMEFIEGESLAGILARGPMPVRQALMIARQVAAALQYAHEHGVVHRDIKPGNILIDQRGDVRVTDFGLAKENTREQLGLTASGQVMGTPRYMSPEQASGKTALADARSDIFSLGTTLYEMLAGQPAFTGENVVEILRQILTQDPVPLHRLNRKIHPDVETICAKAMEKNPAARYQTALELGMDIDRFLQGEPIEAKRAGWLRRGARRLRQHTREILISAVMAFVVFNVVLVALNTRPAHLELTLQTPAATVLLNDEVVTSEQLAHGISLRPRQTYRLYVEKEPEFAPREWIFAPKAGERRALTISLTRRTGSLRIRTDPPDAGVTITGTRGYEATFQGPVVEQVLPTDTYSVVVHKENFLAQDAVIALRADETRELEFRLASVTLWSTPTGGNVLSVPAVADLDSDGSPDVVVGDDEGKVWCLSGRHGVPLWVSRTGDAVQAPPVVTDVNRDGVLDVIVGSTDQNMYAFDGRDGRRLWMAVTKGAILGPAFVRDVDNNDEAEVIFGSDDGTIYALRAADGRLQWKFPTGSRIQSALAWADHAEAAALVVGTLGGKVFWLNAQSGAVLASFAAGRALAFPPRVELAEDGGSWNVYFPTPQTPTDTRSWCGVSLGPGSALAFQAQPPLRIDLDGDGLPEKIQVHENGTQLIHAQTSAIRWESPYAVVTPSMADVNQDGTLDLVFNNGQEELLCISGANGQLLGRIVFETGVGRGFALDDVDRDGHPDVVVGAGRRVYCMSWNGGRRRWFHQAPTYFDAPFSVTATRVLTKTIGGTIACWRPDQAVPVWQVETSPQPSPYSAVVANDEFVADTDARTRRLTVRRLADGGTVWRARLPGEPDAPIGTPTIIGDRLVVGDGDTGLYCFRVQDGTELWKIPVSRVVAAAASDGRFLYIGDGVQSLYCLDLETGTPRWQFQASDPFPTAPALRDVNHDGVADVFAVADNGYSYGFDGATGRLLWEVPVAPVRTRTRHRIIPARDGTDGFLVNIHGEVWRLNLKNGETRWRFPLHARVLGEVCLADSNDDGVEDVIVATMSRRIHCISGDGKRILWDYELNGPARYTSPVYLNGLVLVGTGPPDNSLYCLSARAPKREPVFWTGPWRHLTEWSR